MKILTKGNTCSDCEHSRQHYTRRRRGDYVKTVFGHCVRPRVKVRTVDAPACEKFLPRSNHT